MTNDDETEMLRHNAILLLLTSSALLQLGGAFEANENVLFELYTRESRKLYEVLYTHGEPQIADSKFNASRPTRLFVHGFRSKRKVIERYSEAYLNVGDYNFIAVNWIEASTVNYFRARFRRVEYVNKNHVFQLFTNLNSLFVCSCFCFPLGGTRISQND